MHYTRLVQPVISDIKTVTEFCWKASRYINDFLGNVSCCCCNFVGIVVYVVVFVVV